MRVYADSAAVAAYPGGENISAGAATDSLLRTASRIVDQLLVGRAYITDTDGMPTDVDVVQALEDATCAIVVECVATGATDPGGTRQYASVGIGSVSLSGATTTEGTVSVSGIPVPAAALVALADVGTKAVTIGAPGYVRPLDRIAP